MMASVKDSDNSPEELRASVSPWWVFIFRPIGTLTPVLPGKLLRLVINRVHVPDYALSHRTQNTHHGGTETRRLIGVIGPGA